MLKRTIWWLIFCLILSVSAAPAQKKDPGQVNDLPKNESRSSDSSASKSESSSKSSDSSSKSSDNSPSSDTGPSSTESSSNSSSRSSSRDNSSGRNRTSGQEGSTKNGSSDSSDKGKRFKVQENDEQVNPVNPSDIETGESSPRPGGDRDRNGGDRDRNRDDRDRDRDRNRDHKGKRDDEKDDKDRDKNRRRKNRDRDRDHDIRDQERPGTVPPPFAWFNKNDVVYKEFESFTDANSNNYLPYFQNQLGDTHTPLQRTYLSQISLGTYPFIELDWAFYYEPDMNELFIDFSSFGRTRFERLVLIPLGETARKVAKQYKDTENRPVLVEDISSFPVDKIGGFNIGDLPKGEYSLMLLGMAGETVKIRIIKK